MTNDAAWLAGHAFLMLADAPLVREGVADARRAGLGGVVVPPSHLPLAEASGELTVASVAGWPSGRHHTLVKAAEARLAVAQGATEIWLATDPCVTDPNALLAEIVAVREAVPPPVILAVHCSPARDAGSVATLVEAAGLAGADRVVGASIRGNLPHTAPADSLDAVIAALEQGADRVVVRDVTAACPRPD